MSFWVLSSFPWICLVMCCTFLVVDLWTIWFFSAKVIFFNSLENFLASHFLLSEQVAAVPRKAFAQFWHVSYPFVDQEILQTISHTLATLLLNYCKSVYMGLTLKNLLKFQQTCCRTVGSDRHASECPCNTSVSKNALPICLWVLSKVLASTYQARVTSGSVSLP